MNRIDKKQVFRNIWKAILGISEAGACIQFYLQNFRPMETSFTQISILPVLIAVIPVIYLYFSLKWKYEDEKYITEAKILLLKFDMHDEPMNYVEKSNTIGGAIWFDENEYQLRQQNEEIKKIEAAKKAIRDKLHENLSEKQISKIVTEYYEPN